MMNWLLGLFGRKYVYTYFYGYTSQQFHKDGTRRIGRVGWPDKMSEMEYFMRKEGVPIPEAINEMFTKQREKL